MKNWIRNTLVALVAVFTIFSFVGCTATETTTQKPETVLTDAFTSPARLSYSNFRPTYNYFMTTFSFQALELYSDGTYCLIVSSSQFSALILPEEGNAATGNERTNYILKYYGTYTSETDPLDEGTLNVSLDTPTRVVNLYDQSAFFDTGHWTDAMSAIEIETYPGSGEYVSATPEDYLAQRAFDPVTISVTLATFSFEYVDLVVTE